jgi:uroporphyrinogen-III synthase
MRVAVTRPEPGASATAARLAQSGHEAVVLPLSRIVPAGPTKLPEVVRFDAAVLTSANAVLHAVTEVSTRYSQLPCFAVGDRTAAAASVAGFANVVSADGDAGDLAALIAEQAPAGGQLLYLCGTRRRPELEVALGAAGYVVMPLETYATEPVDPSPGEAGLPVDAILLHSPFAAQRLSAFGDNIAGARLLCMSAQIADALSPDLRGRAEIAASPNEDVLLALVGRAS